MRPCGHDVHPGDGGLNPAQLSFHRQNYLFILAINNCNDIFNHTVAYLDVPAGLATETQESALRISVIDITK